jgi:glycosyltransferase involved in cell wall biosynthesis
MARLRVLHLITHLAVGGAAETVMTTCQRMDEERFETALLSGITPSDEQSLRHQARQSGLKVYELPSLARAIRPGKDVRAYHDLTRWLRAYSPDIIHTSSSKAGIIGRLAAAKVGVPTIIHTVFGWGHHAYMKPWVRRFYIALERKAARVTTRLITVSCANREKGLADKIGTPQQYRVVYNAIDIAKYRDVIVDARALRNELGIAEDALVVGTVSRLAPQKCPEDFVEVAARVHARCPTARFVVVGGGPLHAEFEADVRRRNLQDVVLNLGYRHDVPALLRVFDVFLLTSLWEGLPMVFPQAMCARLPIVGTRVDGSPEAVFEGETGYLAEPRDVETLSDRVLRLLEDGTLRRRMGRAGFERVYPDFCDHEMVRRIEEVYLECVDARSGRDRETVLV